MNPADALQAALTDQRRTDEWRIALTTADPQRVPDLLMLRGQLISAGAHRSAGLTSSANTQRTTTPVTPAQRRTEATANATTPPGQHNQNAEPQTSIRSV